MTSELSGLPHTHSSSLQDVSRVQNEEMEMSVLPGFFLPRTEANEYLIALGKALKEDDMQEERRQCPEPRIGDVVTWKVWWGERTGRVVRIHDQECLVDRNSGMSIVDFDQIVSINGGE